MNLYRKLILFTLILTSIVVVFGAYVRLADAGLGCPDWPGCYGKLTPKHAAEEILEAHSANPHGPVSMPKAWKEMIHRYIASIVGLLIIAIAVLAWRKRAESGAAPGLSTALIGIVVFQGMLGMWTVTLLLKPAIVTAHLIGGMTTLAVLAWLWARASAFPPAPVSNGLRSFARLAFVLLALQIVLGGWVSTNYAALACTDFPTCHGSLWPEADYSNAFHVIRELGMTAQGELLSHEALTAIHWMHRVGALVAGLALIGLALALRGVAATARLGNLLLAAVVLQIALGIANVLLSLPLLLAAAHNAGAALLVVIMVCINYRVTQSAAETHKGRHQDERARHESSFA